MTQIIPHWLHVYQKPKLGSDFVKRHLALNYKHKINVMGGNDTASCELAVTRSEAERIFEQYVGNRVAVYVDNPAEPIWEGLVNRVSYNAGGIVFHRSLDEMYNRIRVNWDRLVTGTLSTNLTSAANNTTSQSIYGIKEGQFKGKVHASTTTTTTVDKLRDRIVTELPYPQTSSSLQGGAFLIRLEMIGFYHTLQWEFNTQNRAEATFYTTILQTDILPNIANGATFFDNTNITGIATPGAPAATSAVLRASESWWDIIQSATEYGDGTTAWIAGIERIQDNTRRIYYRASNRTLKYTARVADGLRVRNAFGGIVRPWTVKPDGLIRVTDVLLGWSATGEDPRQSYIVSIDYDANNGRVAWVGEDNVTIDGAFKLFRNQKELSSRFGQQSNAPRVIF